MFSNMLSFVKGMVKEFAMPSEPTEPIEIVQISEPEPVRQLVEIVEIPCLKNGKTVWTKDHTRQLVTVKQKFSDGISISCVAWKNSHIYGWVWHTKRVEGQEDPMMVPIKPNDPMIEHVVR